MRVDSCKVRPKLTVRIAFVEENYRHAGIVLALQYFTELQWIAQSHVSIAVTIASMELDGKLLLGSLLKSDMQQVMDQWFMCETYFSLFACLCACLQGSGSNVVFARFCNVQTCT